MNIPCTPTILSILLSGFLFTGCGHGEISEPTVMPTAISTVPRTLIFTPTAFLNPTTTATRRSTLTATLSATVSHTITQTSAPTFAFLEPAEGTIQDWRRYFNSAYQYYFSIPPGWTVNEWGNHFIQISPNSSPELKLMIGVRFVHEEVRIQRTGVPEGDIVLVGEVQFMGQAISKGILVYQGRNKLILYHNCTEIVVGDRAFVMGFEGSGGDYYSTDLAESLVETADEIVGTFSLP